ncbi:MAG: hypothetical protein QMB04_02375, partial [Pseudomonadales bacterium]
MIKQILVPDVGEAEDVEVIEVLNKMFEQKPKHNLRFDHNGKEYGFIPVLTNMSFGEFVDLDLLMSDWDTMD